MFPFRRRPGVVETTLTVQLIPIPDIQTALQLADANDQIADLRFMNEVLQEDVDAANALVDASTDLVEAAGEEIIRITAERDRYIGLLEAEKAAGDARTTRLIECNNHQLQEIRDLRAKIRAMAVDGVTGE